MLGYDYIVSVQLGRSAIILYQTEPPHLRAGSLVVHGEEPLRTRVGYCLLHGMVVFGILRFSMSEFDDVREEIKFNGTVRWYVPSSSDVKPTHASFGSEFSVSGEYPNHGVVATESKPSEEFENSDTPTIICAGQREDILQSTGSPSDVPYVDSDLILKEVVYPDGQTELLQPQLAVPPSSPPRRSGYPTTATDSGNAGIDSLGTDETDYGLNQWSDCGLPHDIPLIHI